MYTPLAGHQSMKKIWLIKVLIVLILVPLFPMHAHAQEKASYTFVGTHYPLVFEQDKNGQVHGLGFDILKAISNEMGKTFKTIYLPWGRALRMVKEGSADGIIGLYMSETRKKFLVYSNTPFRKDHILLMTKAGRKVSWDGNFKTLKNHHIITIRHWVYGDKFDAYKHNLNIDIANKLSHGLRMLMANRGDILIANEQSALYEMQKLSLMNDIVFLKPEIKPIQNYFAFSKIKNDTNFQKRFNAALLKLHQTGQMAKLAAKHTLFQK